MAAQHTGGQAFLRACTFSLMAFAAIDAEAQSRRQDTNHRPSVERKKDDFDARIPFDADMRIAAAVAASGDYRIDALLSGYKLPTTTVTDSFYSNAVGSKALSGCRLPRADDATATLRPSCPPSYRG